MSNSLLNDLPAFGVGQQLPSPQNAPGPAVKVPSLGDVLSIVTGPAQAFMAFTSWVGTHGKYALLLLAGLLIAGAGFAILIRDLTGPIGGAAAKAAVL